ncbi:hypothetical protein RB593_006719 [Gaeumannomyces tritici]
MATDVTVQLLTLVITTSPTPSAPSTELLSQVKELFLSEHGRHPSAPASANGGAASGVHNASFPNPTVTGDHGLPGGDARPMPDLVESRGEAEFGYEGRNNPLNSAVLLTISQTRDDVASCAPPIKYICLPSGRLLSYAVQAHVTRYPALLRTTGKLKQSFVPSGSTTPTDLDSESPLPPISSSIPLTPLFFWHDKPHIAETAHYLARVFPTRLAMGRGDFIEDTVGHRARNQMKDGAWAKWACWLYYPDDGKRLCLRHLQGRHWLGSTAEQERKETWIALNIKGGRKMALKNKKKQLSKADPGEAGAKLEAADVDEFTTSLAEAL